MSYEAWIHSPVGILHLEETDGAISRVNFTDDKLLVATEVFPTLLLQDCARQFQAYFEMGVMAFTFPTHQNGTDFQQRVWQQLETISFGKTISYNQLAKQLGDPKCIRAAGTANGRNNLAIVVPCHRVIGSNGMLVGYAGKFWRKQWLLEHEAKWAHGVQRLF